MTNDARDKQPQRQQPKDHAEPKDHAGNGAGLDSEARKHIGRMLKATYDEVAHEPVPDKFLDLLKQLEAAEPRKQ